MTDRLQALPRLQMLRVPAPQRAICPGFKI
jgi:hypothetical protein